jgi:tetratricopeptide (TPR) repeat protein
MYQQQQGKPSEERTAARLRPQNHRTKRVGRNFVALHPSTRAATAAKDDSNLGQETAEKSPQESDAKGNSDAVVTMSKSPSVDPHKPNLASSEAKDWERFQELRTRSESGDDASALVGLQELAASSSSSDINGAALTGASLCLRTLGRMKEARDNLDRAGEHINKGDEGYPWFLLCGASLDIDDEDWKSGLAKFDALLSEHSAWLRLPGNERSLEFVNRKRGFALLALDRPQEALPLLQHAVTLDDERDFVSYCLGKCCYKVGDFEHAEQSLRLATESDLHPDCATEAHYYLGLTYYRRHKHAWAIKELEWCLHSDLSRRVPKAYILKALIIAAKDLGLESEADRYFQMLKEMPP